MSFEQLQNENIMLMKSLSILEEKINRIKNEVDNIILKNIF